MAPGRRNGTRDAALRLLARSDLSTAQLRERLHRRGRPADEVEDAVARLSRAGLLDDARLAAAVARRAVEVKLRGRRRVLEELHAIGIAPPTAERAAAAAFDEIGEAAVLERAIARRADGPVRTRAALRRLHQALLRQGFPPDDVADALAARAGAGADFVEE